MKMAKALALVLALVLVVVCFNSPVLGEDPWEHELGNNGSQTNSDNPDPNEWSPEPNISILIIPDKSTTTGENGDDGGELNSDLIIDVELFLLFRILPVDDFQVMFFKGAEYID